MFRQWIDHPISRVTLVILLGATGVVWHLLTSPKSFDRTRWEEDVQFEKRELALKIQEAILHSTESYVSAKPNMSWVESSKLDLKLANDMRHTKARLLTLISEAERQLWFAKSGNIPPSKLPNLEILNEIRELNRLLGLAEYVHRLRVSLLEADRRSNAALESIGRSDELATFWKKDLPWLESELRHLKDLSEGLHQNATTSPRAQFKFQAFVRALNVDVERLTQTALDIEIHRVDVWMDWATTQPPEQLEELKAEASHQIARLESLSLMTKSLHSKPDPRLQSLQKSLRRMASVSNLDNW